MKPIFLSIAIALTAAACSTSYDVTKCVEPNCVKAPVAAVPVN